MSKISYDALAVEGLKEIFTQIAEACSILGIDFFIVGAIARNIWYVSHGKAPMGTKDIDFAVYVSSHFQYQQLKEYLEKEFQYRTKPQNPFSLWNPDGKTIDLLPFGKIMKENQVIIDSQGLTTIQLDGFEEVFENGLIQTKIGAEDYKACSIPGIVILKLIAFDDRPDRRIKDVKDINLILTYYPDMEANLIWENHFDLYKDNLEHPEVAMIALGREMKKIINQNATLKNRILKILTDIIEQKSNFLNLMIEDAERETTKMKSKMIKLLKHGIIT